MEVGASDWLTKVIASVVVSETASSDPSLAGQSFRPPYR